MWHARKTIKFFGVVWTKEQNFNPRGKKPKYSRKYPYQTYQKEKKCHMPISIIQKLCRKR
jgi:hypothetical protein